MYDKGKIIAGIVIFLVLVLFPVWYGVARGGLDEGAPELNPGTKALAEGYCMADTEWMRANHMDMLDDWRDDVVREGDFTHVVVSNGADHEKSLTRTCMDCHDDYDGFCRKCHDYADVDPYCWECHNKPPAQGGD